jgi:hypothetical protein
MGLIFVKDKLIQKFSRDDTHFIRFINATDSSVRIELAAESLSERDSWYDTLTVACENIEK